MFVSSACCRDCPTPLGAPQKKVASYISLVRIGEPRSAQRYPATHRTALAGTLPVES